MLQTKMTENSLRIAGKAWQVRALLRQYAGSNLTLQQFLERNVTQRSTTR
ncbi:Z-ring formation inhibitor MciZ [Tumebacillus flagellatus]|nr:Z-ring formation inhibitor MciZ [Tumebacillus flagellatus]